MTDMNQNPGQPFGLDNTGGGQAPLTDNEKLLGGLSYVSQFIVPAVLPVILLLTDEGKRSAFIRYHSVHSLGLFVATILWELAVTIFNAIVGAIAPFLLCVTWVLFLVPIVPFLYYGVKAFQGQSPEVPYLTPFLRQYKWL